jgi:PadR family transcriptional regulator, regulatory protein PadR
MRDRKPSAQTCRLLEAFLEAPSDWRYGYDLTKQTGVGAGTLYPALDRLAVRGLLESEWRPSEIEGRPPRHAYRLTADGVAYARSWLAPASAPVAGATA